MFPPLSKSQRASWKRVEIWNSLGGKMRLAGAEANTLAKSQAQSWAATPADPASLKATRPVTSQSRRAWLSSLGQSPKCLAQAHRGPVPLTVPLLLSPGSQARQCYSFQHIYFGPFDLSHVNFSNVSCPQGCSEAVLSLNTGEGQETQNKKGAGTGRGDGGETSARWGWERGDGVGDKGWGGTG